MPDTILVALAKLDRFARNVRDEVPKHAVNAAAFVYKDSLRANLRSARVEWWKHWPDHGPPVRIGAHYRTSGVGINAKATVRSFGPLRGVEEGTRAHAIAPRSALGLGRTRRGRISRLERAMARGRVGRLSFGTQHALKIPGSPTGFAMYAHVRGVHGHHVWARAKTEAAPRAALAFRRSLRIGILRAGFTA